MSEKKMPHFYENPFAGQADIYSLADEAMGVMVRHAALAKGVAGGFQLRIFDQPARPQDPSAEVAIVQFGPAAAQELMDDLWSAGIRPAVRRLEEEIDGARVAHMSDLRWTIEELWKRMPAPPRPMRPEDSSRSDE